MQMKILDNASAMKIVFDLGQYAPEERAKLRALRSIIRRKQVVSFRLLQLMRDIDKMFYHVWYVDCLRYQVVNRGYEASDELNAAVDRYIQTVLQRIDRFFTEASLTAGIA